jgi:hypothetical protein
VNLNVLQSATGEWSDIVSFVLSFFVFQSCPISNVILAIFGDLTSKNVLLVMKNDVKTAEKNRHTHSQPTQQQQQQQQPKQLEFLSHRDTDTQRLNRRQRDAIITLHQNGDSINDVCMKVGCAKSKTEPDYARSLNNRKLQ